MAIHREELTPEEAQRAASRINHLLERAGLSHEQRDNWWNLIAHRNLGNRTPTRAWLDGEYEAVREAAEWLADLEQRADDGSLWETPPVSEQLAEHFARRGLTK